MDDQDASAVATSSTGFSTLPMDIKARIAEMTYEADRGRAAARDGRGADAVDNAIPSYQDIPSLSRVNRDMNKLCSTYLFRSLEASRASHNTFKFRVLPRHAASVQSLDFDSNNRAETLYAFSLLPFLRNLTALDLTGEAINHLQEGLSPEDFDDAFGLVSRRITSLTVDSARIDQTTSVLGCLPSLRRLSIEGKAVFLGDSPIIKVLAQMHLHHLTLRPRYGGAAPSLGNLGDVVRDHQWVSSSTLRSLTLSVGRLEERGWAFVSSFAATLESLSLHIDSALEQPPTPLTTFPRLAHLSLNLAQDSLPAALSAFATSPVQHADIVLPLIDTAGAERASRALEQFVQLRSVDLDLQRQPVGSFVPTLALRRDSDHLVVRCHGEASVPAGLRLTIPEISLPLRKKTTAMVTERAVEGLQFMQNLLGRMAAMGELEKVPEVLEAMEGIFKLKEIEEY